MRCHTATDGAVLGAATGQETITAATTCLPSIVPTQLLHPNRVGQLSQVFVLKVAKIIHVTNISVTAPGAQSGRLTLRRRRSGDGPAATPAQEVVNKRSAESEGGRRFPQEVICPQGQPQAWRSGRSCWMFDPARSLRTRACATSAPRLRPPRLPMGGARVSLRFLIPWRLPFGSSPTRGITQPELIW